MTTFPRYGTVDYYTMPTDDPRRILANLVFDAACWRRLTACTDFFDAVLLEWHLWNERRAQSEASTEVSKIAKQQADRGHVHVSYAEIERRRRLTSVESCAVCGTSVELVHPIEEWQFDLLPSLDWVRCESCAGRSAGAA